MIRRHWLSVFGHPAWLWPFAAAFALAWFSRSALAKTWPSIHSFFPHGIRLAAVSHILFLAVVGLLVFAVMNLLAVIGWWWATVITIDDIALVVRMPLSSNSIPLQAIQDVQTSRPMLGLLFDYGTLIIYSGNETENIDYVPNVESIAHMLYRKNA
jgi:Bacterial PH domain